MRTSIDRFRRNEAATSAIEFAMIAPVLLLMIFGIIGYGYVLGIYHGIQQVASEAARASVSGVTDVERDQIARAFVTANASSYAFIDPAKVSVTTAQSGAPQQTFSVAVAYDMSGTLFQSLASLVSLPPPTVVRRAVIQRGGY
jgi:Flp pilus assembly protein TadG